jgi:RND family efflux transporter MFP subunit
MRFLLLVLSFLASPLGASDRLIPIDAAQRAALRIATTPLTAHVGAIAVGVPATVAIPPAQVRAVSAPLAGLITEVRVAATDSVRAGQVLATLRAADLVGAQRELAQAAVQLRLAEQTAAREEALLAEGVIAEARVQAARAQLAQARFQVAERRAWLRLVGLDEPAVGEAERGARLSDTLAIRAPIDGVVLEQSVVAGARVEPAGTLFRIARLNPLWLEIQAPAELAALIEAGQAVSVPAAEVKGQVLTVGRLVGAAQTVPVRARVDDAHGRLRLNQTVSARIDGVSGARQWRVPTRALVRAQGRSWVFVERPGGFEPVAVRVLTQSAQSAAIDGPFGGAERVVVEGVAALKAAWQGMGGGE